MVTVLVPDSIVEFQISRRVELGQQRWQGASVHRYISVFGAPVCHRAARRLVYQHKAQPSRRFTSLRSIRSLSDIRRCESGRTNR